MTCPHGASTATTERPERTALGSHRFRCRECPREFNERPGTPFNRLQDPTELLCLEVFWRFRSKLSLRDLAAMFLQRGSILTHEAVRSWETKLPPHLTEARRQKRRGAIGARWYVDETYVKGQGQWHDRYRAIAKDGQRVAVRLSETRDLAAAETSFRSAWTVTGVTPDRLTTDGHDAYPRAIRNVFGDHVMHRTNRYLHTHVAQDHRNMKPRYRPMCGVKQGQSAAGFCRLFDELRACLRPQSHRHQPLTLEQRRRIHRARFTDVMGLIAAA